MANWEQINWLLDEGIDAWNQRMNEDQNFVPNFEDADIGQYLWQRYRDDRGRIDLSGINLAKGRLANAGLVDCDLHRATLTHADLKGANLTGASFFRANLRNASLNDAVLVNATFYCADLSGADLIETNLTGVDLTASEPWKALLFDENTNWRGGQVSVNVPDTAKTVGALVNIIENLTQEYSNFLDETILYFRGESEIGWPLKPSVMRNKLCEREARMLVDLMSLRPQQFEGMVSALGQWVLAQHHGLQTRFLDISKNPLVALYNACKNSEAKEGKDNKDENQGRNEKDGLLHIFAVPSSLVKPFNSDTISVVSSFAKMKREEQYLMLGHSDPAFLGLVGVTYREAFGRLYQLIQQEKPYFAERINPKDLYKVFVVEPQQNLERIRAQSGAFLVSAFHERFESEDVLEGNNAIPIYDHYRLTVPFACKAPISKELGLLNIKNETLYPGLDTSAAAVVNRHYQQVVPYQESVE